MERALDSSFSSFSHQPLYLTALQGCGCTVSVKLVAAAAQRAAQSIFSTGVSALDGSAATRLCVALLARPDLIRPHLEPLLAACALCPPLLVVLLGSIRTHGLQPDLDAVVRLLAISSPVPCQPGLQLLLNAGAAVDWPAPPGDAEHAGRTPLMIALCSGNTWAAEALLALGADPAAEDAQGRSVLQVVAAGPRPAYRHIVVQALRSRIDGAGAEHGPIVLK